MIVGDAIAKIIMKSWSSRAREVNGKIPKNEGHPKMQIMQRANIEMNKNVVIALNGLQRRQSIARPVSVRTIVDIVETTFILSDIEPPTMWLNK